MKDKVLFTIKIKTLYKNQTPNHLIKESPQTKNNIKDHSFIDGNKQEFHFYFFTKNRALIKKRTEIDNLNCLRIQMKEDCLKTDR